MRLPIKYNSSDKINPINNIVLPFRTKTRLCMQFGIRKVRNNLKRPWKSKQTHIYQSNWLMLSWFIFNISYTAPWETQIKYENSLHKYEEFFLNDALKMAKNTKMYAILTFFHQTSTTWDKNVSTYTEWIQGIFNENRTAIHRCYGDTDHSQLRT